MWCFIHTLALQVFEALRSQSDYEQFLGSVSAAATSTGQTQLPAVWVRGIAAQLKRADTVGRWVLLVVCLSAVLGV